MHMHCAHGNGRSLLAGSMVGHVCCGVGTVAGLRVDRADRCMLLCRYGCWTEGRSCR